jgi:DNA-binding transcriptional ArsR family regulator
MKRKVIYRSFPFLPVDSDSNPSNINIFVFHQYVPEILLPSMEFSALKPEEVERAANMIKAISHPMRLAILGHLGEGKKMNVTEIHKLLNIEQSTASHHLGILKDKGILSSTRQGKNTLYFLKRKNLSKLVRCISECACD